MATTISGSTAISGLGGSDTNFDVVLQQLKQVESTQINRLEAWKSDWNLRYEAFGKVLEQIQAASSVLAILSNRNNFVNKSVTSSNQNVVTAVANASAQDVQHTITVSQVASNAIWANTGHVFNSKGDIIASADTDFKYNYAGKDYTVHVPKNTTLESFMYMVNNAVDNPGVQISLIQTGSGYVFQIAGKSTGAANDLYVYNNPGLLGMDASGATSTWQTNSPVNPTASITNPTSYTYEIVLANGSKRTVTIKGDADINQLASAINGQINGFGSATVDGSGDLVLDGVRSISRKDGNGTASQGSTTTTLTFDSSNLGDSLVNGAVYTLTQQGGSTFTFSYASGTSEITVEEKDASGNVLSSISLSGKTTKQDLLDTVAATTGGTIVTDVSGNQSLALTNVQAFAQTTGNGGMGGMDGMDVATVTTLHNNSDFSSGYASGSGTDPLQDPPDLVYTATLNDGTTKTITLPSGSTLNDVITALGNPSAGVPSGITINAGINAENFLEASDLLNLTGPGIQGQVTASSIWSIQKSANAVYQVDNWPMTMESASNSIGDVIEGVVFSIQDVGTARISISTDITSVENSIQTFLDAVNSVLITIRELTAYSSDKAVTSTDPNDANYSPSQLTAEKGGLLQGNYGVQLFNSRFKNLLTGTPPGFKSKQSATDILSGDLVATLSSLGIKTCTDQNDSNYGLLVIAPDSSIAELKLMDSERYQDMITNHLQNVVDFFCTSGTGTTSSADFRYGSHIEGITKAGAYDVKYNVDSGGNITSVTIGGIEAKRDTSMPGYYFSVDKGDARGLSIVIDNLSPGDHTGQVRIKAGLVQTAQNFLKDEMRFIDVSVSSDNADAISLKSENGALMVLRDNYKKIMENIDKKIAQEQSRLEVWEARQKRIFANLETILKQYSEQQSRLESQIKQLSSSSS